MPYTASNRRNRSLMTLPRWGRKVLLLAIIPVPQSAQRLWPDTRRLQYPRMHKEGGGPRVVVSTAAFHARVCSSVPGFGGLKETKMFLPHIRVKLSIVGSLRDQEVACSASDRQGSNFESCVWRIVSSHLPQDVSWPSLAYMCTKVA